MLVYWRSLILATYERTGVTLTEQHLYGSARIGMRQTNLLVKNSVGIVSLNPNQRVFYRSVGHKAYEQTNHLGDVLVTLSDKVLNQGGYYQAIVKNASLTYPFGWTIPERTYTSASGEYRFGFNGKENDKETGWQDYGFRLYNPQIARFFSVDPLAQSFPYFTPYQFAGNMPISAVDLDGAEAISYDISLRQREIKNLTNPRTAAEIEEEAKIQLTMMAIAIPAGLALPLIAGGIGSMTAAGGVSGIASTAGATSASAVAWQTATPVVLGFGGGTSGKIIVGAMLADIVYDASIQVSANALTNGGDLSAAFEDVDYLDAALSALKGGWKTKIATQIVIPSLIDVKPLKEEISIYGATDYGWLKEKSGTDVVVDLAFNTSSELLGGAHDAYKKYVNKWEEKSLQKFDIFDNFAWKQLAEEANDLQKIIHETGGNATKEALKPIATKEALKPIGGGGGGGQIGSNYSKD